MAVLVAMPLVCMLEMSSSEDQVQDRGQQRIQGALRGLKIP